MKPRNWFETSHLKQDTGGESIRGGVWAGGAQATKFVIHMGTLAVLARILSPSDYGLLGMAMVFVGVPRLFTSGGLNTATIQRRTISPEQVSNLHWINTGLGLLVALVVCLLAPMSAAFFEKPQLEAFVPALAVPIVFAGFSLQQRALLRRQMLFRRTALVDVGAHLIGAVVGISSAVLAAGYWSLAFRQIATGVAGSCMLWLACGFRPGRFRRDVDVWPMVRFGGALSLSAFLQYAARRVDNLLIGRVFGEGALGLYEQAYRLLRAPVQQIKGPMQVVSLPAMSVLRQSKEAYARYYYRFLELVAFVVMPGVVTAAVFADDLVGLVLGSQWTQSAEIFRWFAPLAFLEPVSTTRGLVMTSHGMGRRHLIHQLGFVVTNTLAVVIGLQWGVNGVAIALSVAAYVSLVPSLFFCFRGTAVSPAGFFLAILRPVLASVVVAAIALVCLRSLEPGTLRLALGCLACAAGYLATWWLVPNMRARGLELSTLIVRKLRPGKKRKRVQSTPE